MRLALVLSLAALVACRARHDAPAPAASVAVEEAKAPASLLAELSIGNPRETWQRVRGFGGPYADALPSSLQVLLATSLSLPPAAAGNVDETVPVVGALLAGNGAPEPELVVAIHVLSGSELLASLTLGDGAKFRRVDMAPRLARLVPANGTPELKGALAVSGNYVLLGSSSAALEAAGRFVAESVTKRAGAGPGLFVRADRGALAKVLAARLRETWQARRAALAARDRATRDAKGRAPDFGDPEVLLAGADNTVEAWLGVLETARELSLRVTPQNDRLRLELELAPSPDGAAALLTRELVIGSDAPLLSLPARSVAALLLRGEPAGNSQAGAGPMVAQLFGERLSSEQRERLVAAIEGFAKSRHGATALGFVSVPAPALLVTCEVTDADAFDRGVGDLLRLLELPPVKGMLTGAVGTASLLLDTGKGGPRRAKVRFSAARPGSGAAPRTFALAWEVRDGVGYLAVSSDESLGLAPFRDAATLGTLPWFGRGNVGLGDRTALAAMFDTRVIGPGAPDDSRLFLSFGKADGRALLALDVGPGALPALARVFALDRSP